MKLLAVLAAVVLLMLAGSLTASAAPNTGTTTLLDTAVSGSQVDVDVSVTGGTPIVPYEYAIQNECYFNGNGKASGNPDSFQRDDIVFWFDVGGVAHATMPVYFHDIPAGSACKVFLIRNNTVVKGSTTIYPVVGP